MLAFSFKLQQAKHFEEGQHWVFWKVSSAVHRNDIVKLLNFIERLKKGLVQIAQKLTFVSAFFHLYHFVSEGFNAEVSCISCEFHDLVQSLSGDNMSGLQENIKSYIISHSYSSSSVTTTEDHLVERLDSLLVYQDYLPKCCAELIFPSMTQYELLRIVCGHLRDFHGLKVNGCVEYETIECLTSASTYGSEKFLLIILTDVLKDVIHPDKLSVLLARVEALTKELCFPMSDGQLFMTLLLRNLNDLLNSNAYSVALIKEEIGLVKEDLEFIR
ncbi:hypothetical protein RND71_025951 [Anisodus tanguticus]|uniref:Uncharacterized protein n=1 Tax=Anisodus tanguticus TaxID=243964 RepID=A0AAE1RMK4_9SOLA|nr:hypothetical protein RND71_025951 [Anisodus tanguticus]